MGLWSLSDYSKVPFAVLGVVPALIIIGVLFAFGGAWLWAAGLVSAAIYFLAGIGLLWISKLFGVFNSIWGYLFAVVLLLGMAAWGWGTDNLSFLSSFSSLNLIGSTVVLQQASWQSDAISFVVSTEFLGLVFSFSGCMIAVTTLALSRKKRRNR
jgi:hypothetical protein